SDRSGEVNHGELDAIDPRGTRIRRLVSDAVAAAWSPDGRMLALLREVSTPDPSPSSFDLYVARADGHGERRLVKDLSTCCGPARDSMSWSPDGSTIAFVRRSSVKSEREIWTVTVARGRTRRLAGAHTPASSVVSVAWSPNGHQIAFVASG